MAMSMIRAIVRPEKTRSVLESLAAAGFPGATCMDVYGRGERRARGTGDIFYDEDPKHMLLFVVDEADEAQVAEIISTCARTGEAGNAGDGRIFVCPCERAYTISSGAEGL